MFKNVLQKIPFYIHNKKFKGYTKLLDIRYIFYTKVQKHVSIINIFIFTN